MPQKMKNEDYTPEMIQALDSLGKALLLTGEALAAGDKVEAQLWLEYAETHKRRLRELKLQAGFEVEED
jgi:hypothetical protein